jgi:PAS domain S-box-containing protein
MDERSDQQGDRNKPCEDEALLLTQFAADHAPDAIFWIDKNARFSYVNEAACRSLEYSCEELLQMGVPDIDPTWPMGVWEANWDSLKEKGVNTFETVHQTKSGRVFPVEIRTNFLEYKGQSLDCAYARDISERRKTEEALRTIQYALDNVSDAAFLVDPGGRFVYANRVAREVSGYSEQELLNMSVSDLDPHFGRDAWLACWEEIREKGTITLEAVVKAKDGHSVPAEIRPSFFEFEGRQYSYAFVRDISERVEAEAEKRAMEQRLEEHKRRFYRETILSVTGGKLDICDSAAVEPYISGACTATDVCRASDVRPARRDMEEFCSTHGFSGEEMSAFTVGVGEAITNALKHAGRGRVFAGMADSEIWVGVKDGGPGIESLILPAAVLRRGFSTKPSLGLGYSIMLDVADRILLKTGDRGTTVVLIKSLVEAGTVSLDSIPDTWGGIPDTVS